MNKKRFVLPLLFSIALLALGMPLAGQQSFMMKKDILVAADETQVNIFTLGGTILVEGTVKETAIAIGGTITVSGQVGEAVVGIGSHVVIKSTAVIDGDLVCLGGILEKEPGCFIGGDTIYFESSEFTSEIFEGNILKGIFSFTFIPIILIFKLIIFFVWLFLAFLGVGLFPKPIAFASDQLRKSFWPVFGIGLLALIIFTGIVVFAALLSIILIGIPVLLAIVGAGIVIKIFGTLVVFTFFGESLLRAFGSKNISTLGAVLMGLLFVSLIGLIPIVGFLFSFFLNVLGWGITIRTKFGTRENWFQKK